jgi:ectoine hydroxylase-related dioxygenase (phytanoyl-CoA dioxygenase family)
MTAMMTDNAAFLQDYRERGFAVVRGAFDPADLEPMRGAISRSIDTLARELVGRGEADSAYAHESIETRLPKLLAGREFGRSWDDPVFGPELHALITHEAIVSRVRAILGDSVMFDGAYRLRPKLPDSELTAFPFHQDSQYYGPGTEGAHIISVWVPFVDVDEENGCLYFIPGSHRWGILGGARGADMNIRMFEDIERRAPAIPLPMRRGDIVLFSNLTVHGSKVNRTPRVRWSIDLRYFTAEDPSTRPETERRGLEAYRAKIGSPFVVSGTSGPESYAQWRARREAAR